VWVIRVVWWCWWTAWPLLPSCRVASLSSPRGSTPTALSLVPGAAGAGPGAVLVVGEDSGEVRGSDVRVLTGGAGHIVGDRPGLMAVSSSGRGVIALTCWSNT